MKHKIIYVVVRTFDFHAPVVLDSFRSLEEAENKAGEFEQTFKDHRIEGFSFQVQTSAYYDF